MEAFRTPKTLSTVKRQPIESGKIFGNISDKVLIYKI
jgi:hypothetical protein